MILTRSCGCNGCWASAHAGAGHPTDAHKDALKVRQQREAQGRPRSHLLHDGWDWAPLAHLLQQRGCIHCRVGDRGAQLVVGYLVGSCLLLQQQGAVSLVCFRHGHPLSFWLQPLPLQFTYTSYKQLDVPVTCPAMVAGTDVQMLMELLVGT